MAGMFTMLNNHMNGETSQQGNSGMSKGGSTFGGNAPNPSTLNRRTQKHNLRSDKVCKKRKTHPNRNQRKFHLHPLLRRGLCTVIIASTFLLTGIVIIVADHFVSQKPISIFGWIVISIAICLAIIGLVWFRIGQKKLQRIKESMERLKLQKLQRQREHCDEIESLAMIYISNHAVPWPSKYSCPESVGVRMSRCSTRESQGSGQPHQLTSTATCEENYIATKSCTCGQDAANDMDKTNFCSMPLRRNKNRELYSFLSKDDFAVSTKLFSADERNSLN